MRTVVLALVMIAMVAGSWVATRHAPQTTETAQIERVDAEAPLHDAFDAAAKDDRASADVERRAEDHEPEVTAVTYTLAKNWGPHGPMSSVYDEPEFRAALVVYLVESGLPSSDSERSADAAAARLSACIALWGFDGSDPDAQACTANALQQAGLSEAFHRTAVVKTARERSRRKALEAAAAANGR